MCDIYDLDVHRESREVYNRLRTKFGFLFNSMVGLYKFGYIVIYAGPSTMAQIALLPRDLEKDPHLYAVTTNDGGKTHVLGDKIEAHVCNQDVFKYYEDGAMAQSETKRNINRLFAEKGLSTKVHVIRDILVDD